MFENLSNKMIVNTFGLPENIKGRSIHCKVIPTVCNL